MGAFPGSWWSEGQCENIVDIRPEARITGGDLAGWRECTMHAMQAPVVKACPNGGSEMRQEFQEEPSTRRDTEVVIVLESGPRLIESLLHAVKIVRVCEEPVSTSLSRKDKMRCSGEVLRASLHVEAV
jgi:hypothetical protein